MPTSFDSPRIARLVQDLEVAQEDILSQFWDEVKEAGLPLVEPLEIKTTNEDGEEETRIDDAHVWVTFLYEGDEDTQNVTLWSQFMMARMNRDPKNLIINRIDGTNIWYWTEKLSNDARIEYVLTRNHPLTPAQELDTPEKQRAFQKQVFVGDPLNPKKMALFVEPDYPDEFLELAIFEAPAAIAQAHIDEREGIAKGSIIEHEFKSDVLDNERKNWIYLPPEYDPKRTEPYCFLLLFDGYVTVKSMNVKVVLDNLLAEGKIPPTVSLILGGSDKDRLNELSPNDKMPRMLAEELMPMMRKQYHLSAEPDDNFIGGVSLGGLASAWNAFVHPEIFGNVISQSGSYWWFRTVTNPDLKDTDDLEHGWLIRQYANSELRKIRFYMDVGRFEKDNGWEEGSSHRSMNRHMRDVLIAKGYEVYYTEYAGGHSYVWWRQTLADALIVLHEKKRQQK